jgi:hypothetical protein
MVCNLRLGTTGSNQLRFLLHLIVLCGRKWPRKPLIVGTVGPGALLDVMMSRKFPAIIEIL